MNTYRLQLVACLSLLTSTFAVQADSYKDSNFLSTPVGAAVKQGLTAAGTCVTHVMEGASYAACILDIQKQHASKGGDTTSYDLGLYFDTWYTMDETARPDEAPTVDIVKQAAAAAKPEAVRFFKLYRAIQKKTSVTDEQLIVLFELNKPELLKARIVATARETGA